MPKKENLPEKRNPLWYSQKISELRAHLGMSQAAFGEKVGVSGASIGQLERGESKSPSADLLAALASILSVNLDWLLNGEGPMLKPDPKSVHNLGVSADGRGGHAVGEPGAGTASLTDEPPAPYGTLKTPPGAGEVGVSPNLLRQARPDHVPHDEPGFSYGVQPKPRRKPGMDVVEQLAQHSMDIEKLQAAVQQLQRQLKS